MNDSRCDNHHSIGQYKKQR